MPEYHLVETKEDQNINGQIKRLKTTGKKSEKHTSITTHQNTTKKTTK